MIGENTLLPCMCSLFSLGGTMSNTHKQQTGLMGNPELLSHAFSPFPHYKIHIFTPFQTEF